jgi:prepilin-type N-terminal cleavage/methylation domain-containing protein
LQQSQRRTLWRLRRKARSEAGFTLIELLVVIAIIGALIAFVVPQVLGGLQNVQVTNSENGFRSIDSALQVYVANNGTSGLTSYTGTSGTEYDYNGTGSDPSLLAALQGGGVGTDLATSLSSTSLGYLGVCINWKGTAAKAGTYQAVYQPRTSPGASSYVNEWVLVTGQLGGGAPPTFQTFPGTGTPGAVPAALSAVSSCPAGDNS